MLASRLQISDYTIADKGLRLEGSIIRHLCHGKMSSRSKVSSKTVSFLRQRAAALTILTDKTEQEMDKINGAKSHEGCTHQITDLALLS